MITSNQSQKLKPFPFDDFQGLDSSRDRASLDTGQMQHLVECDNAYCNFKGVILRDRGLSKRTTTPGDRRIKHINFFGRNLIAWAQVNDGGISLGSEPNGTSFDVTSDRDAIISSTIYRNKIIFCCTDIKMCEFNGLAFKEISTKNDERPSFAVTIQRRLAIAGQSNRRGIVDFSRVDDNTVFSRDESDGETSVTRAGDIDIGSLIGTNDDVTGLGVFETNKIAIFTNDKTFVYTISADISKWAIDDKANINIGTISHNTIAQVNTDLMFCSRFGIHSLRRSDNNGVTIYSIPMSSKIEEIYRSLIRSVDNPRDISAFYDQDLMQYNVFFPQKNGTSKRLTMTINPSPNGENKWSTGSSLNQCCGASFGGDTVVGTTGGVWNVMNHEDDAEIVPTMVVSTPILWCGSMTSSKKTAELILQASGNADMHVEVFNEEDAKICDILVPISGSRAKGGNGDDINYVIPILQQYNRQLVQQFKGMYLKITINGGSNDRVKILGFAILINEG